MVETTLGIIFLANYDIFSSMLDFSREHRGPDAARARDTYARWWPECRGEWHVKFPLQLDPFGTRRSYVAAIGGVGRSPPVLWFGWAPRSRAGDNGSGRLGPMMAGALGQALFHGP